MKQYKYIGETDELTTKGKIYDVKTDGTFIDDTGTECGMGNDFNKYFEFVKEVDSRKYLFDELIKEFKYYSAERLSGNEAARIIKNFYDNNQSCC